MAVESREAIAARLREAGERMRRMREAAAALASIKAGPEPSPGGAVGPVIVPQPRFLGEPVRPDSPAR